MVCRLCCLVEHRRCWCTGPRARHAPGGSPWHRRAQRWRQHGVRILLPLRVPPAGMRIRQVCGRLCCGWCCGSRPPDWRRCAVLLQDVSGRQASSRLEVEWRRTVLQCCPLLECSGGAAGALGSGLGVGLGLTATQRPLARRSIAAESTAGRTCLRQALPVQLCTACLAAVLQPVALGLARVEQRVRFHLHGNRSTGH